MRVEKCNLSVPQLHLRLFICAEIKLTEIRTVLIRQAEGSEGCRAPELPVQETLVPPLL